MTTQQILRSQPVLVDTSVWIDLFRGTPTRQVALLEQLLDQRRQLILGDLILTELLQGLRSEADVRRFEQAFAAYEVVSLVGEEIARLSAGHYRILRSQGITIRRTIDCLIASWCVRHAVPLLHADRDFHHFTRFGLIEVAQNA